MGDARLAPAVNTSLFVGAFVPSGSAGASSKPGQLVLVLDNVRYGPVPILPKDFAAVKQRFAAELGGAKLACDEADKVCAVLNEARGGAAFTELLNVNGRVAMVISSTAQPQKDSMPLLRSAAEAFVARLRADNGH